MQPGVNDAEPVDVLSGVVLRERFGLSCVSCWYVRKLGRSEQRDVQWAVQWRALRQYQWTIVVVVQRSVQCWVRVPSGIDIANRSGVSYRKVQRRWIQCVQQLQRRVLRQCECVDVADVQRAVRPWAVWCSVRLDVVGV